VVDDRDGDGKRDAFLDPQGHDRGGGEQDDGELVAPAGQDAPHSADVDEPDGDQEDDRRQGGDGQPGQWPAYGAAPQSGTVTSAVAVAMPGRLRTLLPPGRAPQAGLTAAPA
jgi:hypothetical protein